MSTCRSISSLAALLAACGGESDVEVYVVMPRVEDVCAHADLASVELHVTGPGPEDFTVRGAGCATHPQFEVDGFFTGETGGQLVLERLQDGFYWVTARVYGTGGELRGTRVMPFDAREPRMAIVFDRPDLPGWPTTELEIAIPACAGEPAPELVRLVVAPVGSFVPAVELVSCRDGRVRVVAPLGPVELTGEGMLADGTVCFEGSTTAVVSAGVAAELPLERSCP